jgi:hypothetical protein
MGAGVIGGSRDRPGQRFLTKLGVDDQGLTGGDVGADADRQLRQS